MTATSPPDLLRGAATSAYPAEVSLDADGRGASVAEVFARRPGAVEDGGDGSRACDSCGRRRDDVVLVAGLGPRVRG